MNAIALIDKLATDKKTEIAFIAIFSALIVVIFYFVISMNGVVLGNDPAVHLEKAKIFLNTGQISLANLSWTPPLYAILLAMLISLSGATDVGQMIFLVKVIAVVADWLLFMAVYLIGSKFFNRKVGVAAAIFLLMCFPTFEANQFGGYTTVLALAFMFLVMLYIPLAIERFGYLVVAFFAAFGLVLSHQLAAFLAVFIFPPVLLFMLIKSRGAYLKVVLALTLGGGIAFFLYYFQAMAGYLDIVIEYVFFAIKAYAYQIPAVSFNAFMVNFGFIFFLALAGIVISYHTLKKQKKLIFCLILVLSFFVPLFFAESYLVGFYMPFGWFIYYLTPTMAILAAVSLVFFSDKFLVFYGKHRTSKKTWLKVAAVSIIVLLSLMVVFRSDTVYGKIVEASVYYATSDMKAYDAGLWLKANYPNYTVVIDTQIPGYWFKEFSGKETIAQTDPAVQRTEIAESVLSLSYELEHPQTLLEVYQAKGDTSDEMYVSLDQVWNRISFSSATGDFLIYMADGVEHKLTLSDLSKQIVFEDQASPKKITFIYTNNDVQLTKTIAVENTTYPLNVSYTLTPLKSEINNATLYLTTFFDLRFSLDKAQIPQLMDWINPWDAPPQIKTAHVTGNSATDWAVANFSSTNLQDNYIGLYDDKNDVAFAFKFNDLPDWGNIGALANRQIDAVRFQYQFNTVKENQTVSRSYQMLTLSKNSYPALLPSGLLGLFSLNVPAFTVSARDFSDYIRDNGIGFIVYDRNKLDPQMIKSKLLQLIYSNDRYAIFKIINQP